MVPFCEITGKSPASGYRSGCRCFDCKAWRKTKKEDPKVNAARAKAWRDKNPIKSRLSVKNSSKKNPDRVLRSSLKIYGLSLSDYRALVLSCGNKCMLCCGPPVGKKRLSVDHCHVTGKVRGLLCNSCNVGLGYFMDSIVKLDKAIVYLRERGN